VLEERAPPAGIEEEPSAVLGVQEQRAGPAATTLPLTGGEPFTVPLLAFVAMIAAGAFMRWRLRTDS
jgi:LPXTG-motif cell wall-anchored protein